MRNLIVILLLSMTAVAADNVIVPKNSGKAYFKDVSNNLMPLKVSYTTDGNGHLQILSPGGGSVDDSLTIPPNTGTMYLNSGGKLYPAQVIYTTDGAGHVQPVSLGGGGTVTSVSGTLPISSSGGATPAISCRTATGSVSGCLSSADWTTFNGKQAAGSYAASTTTISTTAPITGGGDLSANRTFAIPAATSLVNGYLTSTDWSTFNGKQAAGSYATTATTISTTAPITGGGDLSTNRTFAIPAATSGANGYLTSTDWSTFNGKQRAMQVAVIEEQQTANTNGGSASTGSYINRVLNTVVTDDIGVTLASNTVTLPAGTYTFEWTSPFNALVNETRTRLWNNTASSAIQYSMSALIASGTYAVSMGQSGKVVFAGSTDVQLQYQVGTAVATTGLGHETSGKWGGSEPETYSHLKIIRYL